MVSPLTYFAYCVAATDLLQPEGGVSIITENAMAEVGKYLSQNKMEKTEISHKKKVLVVDLSTLLVKKMTGISANSFSERIISSTWLEKEELNELVEMQKMEELNELRIVVQKSGMEISDIIEMAQMQVAQSSSAFQQVHSVLLSLS